MTKVSHSSSPHWLLGPHRILVSSLSVLEGTTLLSGVTLEPTTTDRVSAFIEFEQHYARRRVGPALKEHLALFGSYLAMLALDGQVPVGSIRMRIFHEWDSRLTTLLVANLCVHPSHRNRTIATQMVRHLSRLLLAAPCVEAIGAEVDKSNLPSIRVFIKNGFHMAGHSGDPNRLVMIKKASELLR